MPDVAGLLAAGCLLPANTKTPPDEPVEVVGARAYRHPALGDRPVVRLVQSVVAPAEDLTLDFLGFGPPVVTEDIGLSRRRALGFPGWALVHDPANAGFALAVVKDMERQARVARAKPGLAKEGYEALAAELARSAPQLLPSFYEQAGRAYLANGNTSLAGTMFGKARDAELAYGLVVDEDRRLDAFLEFALAAALPARTLDEYARRLADGYPPEVAFGHFHHLAIQRTLGGLPPWTGMVEGLRRLGKAAGRSPDDVDRSLLHDLLEAPATALAAMGFWKPLGQAVVGLAREDPAVRGRLLNLFPKTTQGENEGLSRWWLGAVVDSGADEGLVAPAGTVPPEAEPAGGPAAWLARLVASSGGVWGGPHRKLAFGLVERMAARLAAEGAPVQLVGNRFASAPDLADLAISLGIPVADPPPGYAYYLAGWLRAPASGRRPLDRLVADPVLGPALARGVSAHLAAEPAAPLLGSPGLRTAVGSWLGDRAEALGSGGLDVLRSELDRIAKAATADVVALNPAAAERIRTVDVAAALGRTLRAGVMDELGWPALEAAMARLPEKAGVTVEAAFPYAILSTATTALLVGPEGILLEHDLRLPPPTQRHGTWLTEADGQLLVTWREHGDCRGYWTSDSARVLDLEGVPWGHWDQSHVSLPAPGGGRTFGGRPLRAGDTKVARARSVAYDGEHWWRLDATDQGALRWREVDIVTGAVGRPSIPRFFESAVEEGWELAADQCWLLPLPEGCSATPLGSAGGLVGLCVRSRADGIVEGRGIDGRTTSRRDAVTMDWRGQRTVVGPSALVRLPGDDDPRALRPTDLHTNMVDLLDPTGSFIAVRLELGARAATMTKGTALVVPPPLWHALRPRDPAGSADLRRLSDDEVRRLLDACRAESVQAATKGAFSGLDHEDLPQTRAVLAEVAPAVRDLRLVRGVLGVAQAAAFLARTTGDVVAKVAAPTDQPVRVEGPPDPSEEHLREALNGIVGGRRWWGAPGGDALQQARVLGAWLTPEEAGTDPATKPRIRDRLRAAKAAPAPAAAPPALPASFVAWPSTLGGLGAVAFRAALATTPTEDREALVALLRTLAGSGLATPGRLERFVYEGGESSETARLVAAGPHRWFLQPERVYRAQDRAGGSGLGVVDDGDLVAPPGLAIVSHEPLAGWSTPERIERFCALLAERGPVPWSPGAVARLVDQTGLTSSEAALLLSGLLRLDDYSHNFLPKAVREAIGLKVADASAAQSELRRVPSSERLAILDEAMPAEPAELWASGIDGLADRLALAWTRRRGRRVAVPEEVMTAMKRLHLGGAGATDLLAVIADPSTPSPLHVDGSSTLNEHGYMVLTEGSFDGAWLEGIAMALSWLAATLPAGQPLLAGLPDVLALARRRLGNQDLLAHLGYFGPEEADRLQVKQLPACRRLESAIPTHDAGSVVFVVGPWQTTAYLRPSSLRPGIADAWVDAVVGVGCREGAIGATRFLISAEAEAIAERARRSPLPPGRHDADPRLSVPEVVAAVASTTKLDELAATLYLQLLTLAGPTTKALAAWNQWSAADVKRAAAPLLEAGLVVQGKRPRAGRDVFLPGPWINRVAPDLPLETWKLPLYGADEQGHLPLGMVLPLRPLPQLFAAAWDRWEAGDRPGLVAPARRAGQRATR